MIKQEHFASREKIPYTPPVEPVKSNILLLPGSIQGPQKQHPAFNRNYNYTEKMREKVVLEQGDSFVTEDEARRATVYGFANSNALNRGMHNPKWAFKAQRGGLEDLTFLDLFLLQGLKLSHENCFFAKDAAGALVCFNVRAFRVRDYLTNFDAREEQVYSILDPFSLTTLGPEIVKKHFSDHPRYLEFMTLKGHEAV